MTERSRRWASLATAAGGLAWTGWALVAATTGNVDGPTLLLAALSGLLLAVGLAGIVPTTAWAYRFPGGEGAGLGALGALAFAAGQGATALSGSGDLATWLLVPGVLGLVGGTVLLGVGLVRARRTPPWLGVAVVVGAVCFLLFEAVPALALPFGLAWVALGGHLWRHPDRPTDHLEPSALGR